MRTLNLEDANKDLRMAFLKAHESAVKIVEPNGEAVGVLLSYDDFRAMQIRLDLASDPEDLVKIISDGSRFQNGDMEGFEDVRALLKEYGMN